MAPRRNQSTQAEETAQDRQLVFDLLWSGDGNRDEDLWRTGSSWDVLHRIMERNGKISKKRRKDLAKEVELDLTALVDELTCGHYSNILARRERLQGNRKECLNCAFGSTDDNLVSTSLDEEICKTIESDLNHAGKIDEYDSLYDDYYYILQLTEKDPNDTSIYQGLSRYHG